MARWIDALARTRGTLLGGLARLFGRKGALDGSTLEEIEETLVRADVAPTLALEWVAQLQAAGGDRLARLREVLLAALGPPTPFAWDRPAKPLSILVVGINGAGKTTTCAKLARVVQHQKLRPLLAAADTFRAAGSDQLRLWAERLGCEVVAGATGADAAAVAFDAMDAAMARHADVLIVDTAGRMHTRQPLMQELSKVRRAMAKRQANAPDETWVVLDGTMGQNALAQARLFHEATPLTGVVVAKLDGSAKAGFIFSVARELQVPVRMVGLGEGADDLVAFDPVAFVDGLLDLEPAPATA